MSGETMLSKMADAIWRKIYEGGTYEDAAKAALLAIREPSDDVLIASGMLDADGQELARSIWRDMVGFILNESPSPSVTHQTGDKP